MVQEEPYLKATVAELSEEKPEKEMSNLSPC